MIATTSPDQAIGILMGYKHVKSCPSTMSFYLVTSYGSSIMSRNMAQIGWLQEKVSRFM
jgi:hypothetical protein